jgi:hypothetical protein
MRTAWESIASDLRRTIAREIRERHGYRDFAEEPERWRLVRWLYTRAWLSAERPIVLFDLATARMTERGILLPGVTTLARLIGSISDRAAARLWKILAQAPHRGQRQRLQSLLRVPESTARLVKILVRMIPGRLAL